MIDIYALNCNCQCRMNIDQLKQFCTIVEVRTIARASQLMHLTPGALSRSMKRLESELGLRLFTPVGRLLVLSDQGHAFFQISKRLLDDFNNSVKVLLDGEKQKQIIRLATFEVFSSRLLVDLIAKKFADLEVLMQELTPGQIESAVSERRVDFGITYVPMPQAGLDLIKVGEFRMVACTRRGTFASQPFHQIPFAVPITSFGQNIHSLDSLDGWPSVVSRKVRYRFELLESALEACRQGLCAVHIPEFIAAAEGFIPIQTPKSYRIKKLNCYLVKREAYVEDLLLRKLLAGLRAVIKAQTLEDLR